MSKRLRFSAASRLFASAAALLLAGNTLFGAATVQEFSNPTAAGTPVTAEQWGGAPSVTYVNGAARIVADTGSQKNFLSFDGTGLSTTQGVLVLTFDYFMPDETGHTGCCGERADGFGVALVDTNVYRPAGPIGDVWGAVEQDALASALTIGFDIFTGNGDGTAGDNTVRIGVNGTTVLTRSYDAAFKLNNGQWNRVTIRLTPSGSDLILDMSIKPASSPVENVFTATTIPSASLGSSRLVFAGRTGGAFVPVTIDNVQAYSGFTAGPAVITQQPVNATATETFPASFSLALDGTPPYFVQWYSNGVAIAGADQLAYSIATTTTNMNGSYFYAIVSNALSSAPITSSTGVLTVNAALLTQSASAGPQNNRMTVRFIKPVTLSGTYTVNNGVTVNSIAYGANQREVVLTTTPLTADTGYTITVTGETGQDGSALSPNPSTLNTYFGFGNFCTTFASMPVGAAVFGSAVLGDDGTGTNQVLHVTDAVNGVTGGFVISNLAGAAALDVLRASFRLYIGDGTCCGANFADGLSFNWANNLPFGTLGDAEEGTGSGLTVAFDTWDNAGGEAPAIDLKWNLATFASTKLPIVRNGTNFVPVLINVDPDGTIDVTYDGIVVHNNVTIPGFAPISNSRIGIYARTGGANENAWVDDLCINNFTVGNVFFAKEPVTTTVPEGTTATFTAQLDGSPGYYYQWFTNGVAVPGATASSFTTAPVTEAMQGLQVSVIGSNLFSTVTSSNATLNVQVNPRVVSVSSRGTDEIVVVWSRPVDLNSGTYNLSSGLFEANRYLGANASTVIIQTDNPLVINTTYTLTVEGVVDAANPANGQTPASIVRQFRHGFGYFCADFNDNQVPAGTTLRANLGAGTRVEGGFIHLTDAANDQNGTFFIPDPAGGFPIDRLLVEFRTQLGSGTCCGAGRWADGMSLSIGSDVTVAGNGGEEGFGNGLVVTFDTWDSAGTDTAPAIEVRYKGVTHAFQSMAGVREANRAYSGPLYIDANGNPLSLDTSNQWANVRISVAPDGKLDLYFKDYHIFKGLQLTNYTPFTGANYSFGARTGGANQNHWLDDICINGFTLGGVSITGPADATVNEFTRARFLLDVDGVPPYSIQWYSNNVAIPGETSLVYTTPIVNRTRQGNTFFAVVSNEFGAITSRVAVLNINNDVSIPQITSARAVNIGAFTNVNVVFSEPLDPATANNPANYTLDHGITVTGASLNAAGTTVTLTTSAALDPLTCYKLTVSGVKDVGTFNTVNTNTVLFIPRTIQGDVATGTIVIEAEDWDTASGGPATPAATWQRASSLPGFVGSGYADATPNVGNGGGDAPATFTNSSTMTYSVNFPVAGTYYMWARGSTANDGANNSFHFGIDGVSPDEFTRRVGNRSNNWGGDAADVNKFGWQNDANGTGATSRAQITITQPGNHILNIWMREDGIKLDRFVLTTNAAFSPGINDVGPAASARTTDPARINIVRNPDNSVVITWAGQGWVLQGTPKLETNPALTPWQTLPNPSGTVIPPGYFGTGNTNVFFRLICP